MLCEYDPAPKGIDIYWRWMVLLEFDYSHAMVGMVTELTENLDPGMKAHRKGNLNHLFHSWELNLNDYINSALIILLIYSVLMRFFEVSRYILKKAN